MYVLMYAHNVLMYVCMNLCMFLCILMYAKIGIWALNVATFQCLTKELPNSEPTNLLT